MPLSLLQRARELVLELIEQKELEVLDLLRLCAYSMRQKNLSELARSTVAAVHINSCITLCMPTHVDRMVLAQPSVHKERRAAKAWCTVQQRGMGLLKRWVVVRVACLLWPVQPRSSTAVRAHMQYIRVILAVNLLSSTLLFGQVILTRRVCVGIKSNWVVIHVGRSKHKPLNPQLV